MPPIYQMLIYGGTYYEKSVGGYKVVEPMAGTMVLSLPEGVKVDEDK